MPRKQTLKMQLNVDPRGNQPFDIRAAADDPETIELRVYDDIGPDWAGMIGGETIARELAKFPDAKTIRVRINSVGGSTMEATAIYNALVQHPARVEVDIDGYAMSAATYIAMAGDVIRMGATSIFMIHDPWTFAIGNAEDLRKDVEILDKIAGTIARVYSDRTGMSVEKARDLMRDETFMTADEAKEHGFIDEIMETKTNSADTNDVLARLHDRIQHYPDRIAARLRHNPMPRSSGGGKTKEPPKMKTIDERIADLQNSDREAYDKIVASAIEQAQAKTAEQIKAAEVKAADEATTLERERCTALAKAFGDQPEFLAKQIESGNELGKAKAEAFDALKATMTEQQAKQNKTSAHDGGTQPVSMQPPKNSGNDEVTPERVAQLMRDSGFKV